jgi:hypothetical protein
MDSHQTPTDQNTPRELLNEFYLKNNLGQDGGNSEPYVRIELYKNISIYFPNFDARRKVVLKHDVHHLLTGYSTVLKGETEISAWELASGCSRYPAAFAINLHGMMMGVPFNLKGIFKAFVKGRRTKNLYADPFTNEEALDMPIADLRKYLLLDTYKDARSTLADWFGFIGMLFLGALNSLLSLILLPVIGLYTLYVLITHRKSQRVPLGNP